jgi:hypothetical protein
MPPVDKSLNEWMQIVRIASNGRSFKNRDSGSGSDKTFYQQLAARI